MSKGGSSTSVEIPQYIEDAAKFNLQQAGALGNTGIAQLGYVPQSFGPTVAAFSPMQMSAFGNTAQAADAFGLGSPTGADIYGGMGEPTTYANGVRAYSAAPIFNQTMNEFAAARPGQANFINSMFIDPFSGTYDPINPNPPVAPPVTPPVTPPPSDRRPKRPPVAPPPVIVQPPGTGIDVPVVPELPYIPPEFDEPIIPFLPNPFRPDPDPDLVPIGDAEPGDPIAEVPIEPIKVGLLPDIQIPDVPGQKFQFYNPDIDYSDAPPPFESGGQYVGTLDPSAEGLAAMEAAYGVNPEFYSTGLSIPAGTFEGVTDEFGRVRRAQTEDIVGGPSPIYSASDFPLGLSTQGYDFSTYADPSKRGPSDTATNPFGSTVSVGFGVGQVDGPLARANKYTQQPTGVLENIFGPTNAATQERLADEIEARARSTENSAQGRANELNALIQNVGGQELLDSGAQLAGDQTMSLQSQFGTLTTTQAADQANLSQKGVPTGKGNVKATRKVLDKAAQDGNLGAYVDSFMAKFGNDLSGFQEKTGISNAILKDIQKIAAAKGS